MSLAATGDMYSLPTIRLFKNHKDHGEKKNARAKEMVVLFPVRTWTVHRLGFGIPLLQLDTCQRGATIAED